MHKETPRFSLALFSLQHPRDEGVCFRNSGFHLPHELRHVTLNPVRVLLQR